MTTRDCPVCRTPLPAEARFCLSCGAPTPTDAWQFDAPERTPPAIVAAQLERLRKALAGRYAVERVLGQGGMATVYVAEDVRHHRKVAVKVLRPELAAALGPDRFLREIQVVAQLHHPHILMLIDSGEADGALFYVMPYIEGESLRGRLARERELPVAEAVRIIRDVADALAEAHRHGIVHRDIKPDNILMTGRHALVADFGIAKAVTTATQQGKVTTAGVSLGTPAYMAPEQAMADPATDHRADIYALGVVAYELLTGAPPFQDAAPQNVLSAHVTQRPVPVEERRTSVPPPLAALVMKCLEKHAADRWQSADELLAQLESFVTPSIGMTPTSARLAARPPARPGWLKVAAGAGMVALVGAIALLLRGTGDSAPPPASQRQITFDGSVTRAELSPDGRSIAYGQTKGDSMLVQVRDIAGGSPVRVATLRRLQGLRWTPDGTSLYIGGVDSAGQFTFALYPRLGGAPRPLSYGPYITFSPDGSRYAAWSQGQRARFYLVGGAGSDDAGVPGPDTVSFRYNGDWSPAGDVLAVMFHNPVAAQYELWTLDIGRRAWHRVASDSAAVTPPRWGPRGEVLYYVAGAALKRVRVRPDGSPRGQPVVVQAAVESDDISLSAAGDRVVFTRVQPSSNVALSAERVPGSGRFEVTRLTEGTAVRERATFSPDGVWIAYREKRAGATDIFVMRADGGERRQLSTGGRVVGGPAWSPNGDLVAYLVREGGTAHVAIREVAPSGGERIYRRTQVGESGITWAPAERILYQRPGNHNFNLLDPRTEGETPLVRNPEVGWVFEPVVAPDKKRVAVDWNRRPQAGVWVVSMDDTIQRPVVMRESRGIGKPLGWSRDGRAVWVHRYSPNEIGLYAVDHVSAVPLRRLPPPSPRFTCDLRDGPRGIRMACTLDESQSDAWLMEGFDGRR